jgi:hypothetical protein
MKHLISFLFLSIYSFSLFAQNKIPSINEINFYGVDFSQAKLWGLKEDPSIIKNGLCRINQLFISESKKYDVATCMRKKVVNYCLTSTNRNNEEMDIDKMTASSNGNEFSESQIQEIISGLSCEENEGTGLVFIAEELNKPDKKAFYRVVFFDEKSKEILYAQRVSTTPSGFGVRNYWAGSVYQLMKDWKYKKIKKD